MPHGMNRRTVLGGLAGAVAWGAAGSAATANTGSPHGLLKTARYYAWRGIVSQPVV